MRKAIVYSLILGLCLANPAYATRSGGNGSAGGKSGKEVSDPKDRSISDSSRAGFEAGGTDGMSKKATAKYWDGLHAKAMDKYNTLAQAEPDTQEYYDAADSYYSAKMGYEYGVEADKYDGDLSKSYQVKELPDWGF